jgi:hypothetical protein
VTAIVGNVVTENEVSALIRGFLTPPPRAFVVSTAFADLEAPFYSDFAEAISDAQQLATALQPYAVRFIDRLVPETVNVTALAAQHVYVTDIAGSVVLDFFYPLLRGDAVDLSTATVALDLNNLRVAIDLN